VGAQDHGSHGGFGQLEPLYDLPGGPSTCWYQCCSVSRSATDKTDVVKARSDAHGRLPGYLMWFGWLPAKVVAIYIVVNAYFPVLR